MEKCNKTTFNLPTETVDMINEIFCKGILENNKISKKEIVHLAVVDFYKKFKEITTPIQKNILQELRKNK